jgi:hypothetical protein
VNRAEAEAVSTAAPRLQRPGSAAPMLRQAVQEGHRCTATWRAPPRSPASRCVGVQASAIRLADDRAGKKVGLSEIRPRRPPRCVEPCRAQPRSVPGRSCAGTPRRPLLRIDAGAEARGICVGAELMAAGERGSRGGGRSSSEEGGGGRCSSIRGGRERNRWREER